MKIALYDAQRTPTDAMIGGGSEISRSYTVALRSATTKSLAYLSDHQLCKYSALYL